jgi:hypothetical protein
MKTLVYLLVWALSPALLSAQSGFAHLYDATAGFRGVYVANTTYGYRVFADPIAPEPDSVTRLIFETGPDGAFWGIVDMPVYAQPAGALTAVAPSGSHVTAETLSTATGLALRIRRWYPGTGGVFENLAEINFENASSLVLERLVFQEIHPGGVFLAGHYRTNDEPNRPQPFLVRSPTSSFSWWIHRLDDIPPSTFAFTRLTGFSNGGAAAAFKKFDESVYVERFDSLGASLWRRSVGGFPTTVTSLSEGPGGATFYTAMTPPISGPAPTYGRLVAVAADGSTILDLDLNALLGQFSVSPAYVLPLPAGGAVVAGFESPFLGAGSRFFLARLDGAGQLTWKRNYYFFPEGATFTFGRTTPDNGYIFTGSAEGKVFLFKTDQNGVSGANTEYCPSQAEFPWHDWIAGVHIGGIQNPSGKSPYSDFLALATDLPIGQPAEIALTAGFSYSTYDEYFTVWIDYNRDNVFGGNEKAVEAILPRPPDGTPSQTLTAGFTVPDSVQPGPTRLRVSMQRQAFAGPCDVLPFGEVEDYTVHLTVAGPAPDLTTPAWEVIPANASCSTDPGQAFAFLAGLALNTGTAAAGPFTARAWLSPDDQPGNADDIPWQTVTFDSLGATGAPGNPLPLTIDAPVPAATPPGFYHLFVEVDAGQEVQETDETNNLFQTTVQIGAPDYFLQNLAGLPDSLPTGGPLAFSFEINHSNSFPLAGLPGGAVVSVFLSPDQVPNNGNEVLLGVQTLGFDAFGPAGVASQAASLPLPGSVTAGTYYLIVQVMPTGFCDRDFENNTLIGPAIKVTGPPVSGYCAARGIFPWHDWIAAVTVADLSNNSGKSPYTDFSALAANLTVNTTVPVTLTAGYSWTAYDEHWKIWIDFDQDGVFEEPDETAFLQHMTGPADGTPQATITGSITVPATALPGATRMRVAMKRGAAPGAGPCETFAFGEVEDYSVNIASSFRQGDARAGGPAPEALLWPNPASELVFLNLPPAVGAAAVKMFDRNGRLVLDGWFERAGANSLALPVNGLANGVYLVQALPENGPMVSVRLVVMR